MDYSRFFEVATGSIPYSYQIRLAECPALPDVVSIPTGMGKTAAVVIAWLWRRCCSSSETRGSTPRRLVYCLPTRVLVRQTMTSISTWLNRLSQSDAGIEEVKAFQLLGGEHIDSAASDSWEIDPISPAIIVGTQDMLLSRALNRGYAMSRFSWPIPFALLNSDSLWVLDETQLMGPGLTTSVQLAGLRRKLGVIGPSHTLWMSATIDPGRLDTIDNDLPKDHFTLDGADLASPEIDRRLRSRKSCAAAMIDGRQIEVGSPTYAKDLVAFASRVHRPGTLTLIVVNTVGRCQEVFRSLSGLEADVGMIHSGFRRIERDRLEVAMLQEPRENGSILVSTQVVEAGVDISAATLITEPAPWPSLVQRIGRCNRKGEYNETGASVFWTAPSQKEADSLPYLHEEVLDGVRLLSDIEDVPPLRLASVSYTPKGEPAQAIRRKDLFDLFDTTPDLLGFDLDISRFIREADEPDVHVFWRELPDTQLEEKILDAQPDELCRISLRQFAVFLKKADQPAHVWDHIMGKWARAYPSRLMPGAVYLLDASAGGYSDRLGWTGNPKDHPTPASGTQPPDHQSADRMTGSVRRAVTISEHATHVASEVERLNDLIDSETLPILHRAALWHDAGKAHPVFREAVGAKGETFLAKSPEMKSYNRKGFRHELASALMALQSGESELLCYLVAAHHGKIRLSLRSQPGEIPPEDRTRRFARGIHEGDRTPALDLPGGISIRGMELDLAPMEMGSMDGRPSWRHMSQCLLESYGPFRLAWLEAILRISDWRASAKEADNA